MSYTTVKTLTLIVQQPEKARRGFLKQLVSYGTKKGTFTVQDLTRRFAGKTVPSKGGTEAKATAARITRYAHWCVKEGIMAPVTH